MRCNNEWLASSKAPVGDTTGSPAIKTSSYWHNTAHSTNIHEAAVTAAASTDKLSLQPQLVEDLTITHLLTYAALTQPGTPPAT